MRCGGCCRWKLGWRSDRLIQRSKESAEAILTAGTWASEIDPSVPASYPCHENTANRLVSPGLLSVAEENHLGFSYDVWSVTPLGQELLRELISPNKTPLALLAESLCSDLVSSAMQTVDGIEVAVRSSAVEATASTARMVAHEARNALLLSYASPAKLLSNRRRPAPCRCCWVVEISLSWPVAPWSKMRSSMAEQTCAVFRSG